MLVNTHKLIMWMLLVLLASSVTQPTYAQTWTLKQCIDTAMTHNKNIMISRNNALISEQKLKAAWGGLMPKVNANADYRYYTNLPYQLMPQSAFGGPEGVFNEVQFGVPHNINANVQITMPLYNSQVNGAIQATKIATEISEVQNK